MAGDRAHYPPPSIVEEAISDVGNAMQIVAGWLQTMTDDELEHLHETLLRSLRVVGKEQERRAHGG